MLQGVTHRKNPQDLVLGVVYWALLIGGTTPTGVTHRTGLLGWSLVFSAGYVLPANT